MSNDFMDHRYRAKNIDLEQDLRQGQKQVTERYEDVLDSMLNVILNHKKELHKIPQCTTVAGAKEWASKRPGFRAQMRNIGGDPEPEVVVFDKAGKPVVVNGYQLKPSDYGLRTAYWEANPTKEARIDNPMRKWAENLNKQT